MTARRYIRDTVANDWSPAWKTELDKRMAWLDEVERQVLNDKHNLVKFDK
jgi:hypothetical protein